ncbi:MAG: hypothetical protein WAO52_05005 [Prolixibacteraceae bacterium]
MKKLNYKNYLLTGFLAVFCWTGTLNAQPKISNNEAKQLVEKTVLITDREIYAVDEDILFSAFNSSSAALQNVAWSNILYVELVAPDGESFVRRKFNYGKDGASGVLRIPKTVLTGNYYLRAYTRWMRDYSPYNYEYKMITIINPFQAELLEPAGGVRILPATERISPNTNGPIQIKTNRTSFKKHDKVNLEIFASGQLGFQGKLVVSVIPSGAETLLPVLKNGPKDLEFSPGYIPETRGLSVSGKVVNAIDSVPMAYNLVGLTIFKQHPENRNVLTNEKGQFFFDLSKLEGEYEIFISTKAIENQTPLILVDNDFSTQELKLPYQPVDFSEKSSAIYESLIFNSQMQTLYRQQETEETLKSFSSDSAFYGTPDFVLKLSNFISLPSVKDYFYELIPQVGVRKEGKKSSLKVLGNYSELAIYEPLVLVDMVPIFDIEKVLALQPEKIERIEVVTTPYIRGDIIFGGIVSLFSKKGDLAGIDLPAAGRFITYNMLSSENQEPVKVINNKRIPDLRNCLYWNPDLKLNGNNPAELTFDAGNNSGDYLVVVRGLDQNGKVLVATSEIKIE